MFFIPQFIKRALTSDIKKLEEHAYDTLELPEGMKALRVDDEVVVIDSKKNKILKRFDDTFPSNPARATIGIMKKMEIGIENKASKDTWTCGFREADQRWVWYLNSQPKMTASFKDVYPSPVNNDKESFFAAKYGTTIIDEIKKSSFKEVAKYLPALVLENSYTNIKCGSCNSSDNYTIDDLVDSNRVAKYESNFVICTNCNQLVELIT